MFLWNVESQKYLLTKSKNVESQRLYKGFEYLKDQRLIAHCFKNLKEKICNFLKLMKITKESQKRFHFSIKSGK